MYGHSHVRQMPLGGLRSIKCVLFYTYRYPLPFLPPLNPGNLAIRFSNYYVVGLFLLT